MWMGWLIRDEYRPHTRPLLLLGLALARSMVNLINIEKNNRAIEIYYPFCGMGSTVQGLFFRLFCVWIGYRSECVYKVRKFEMDK